MPLGPMRGLHVLLVHREVVGRGQGVRRAAAQMSLVEDGEATVQRPQVHMFLGNLQRKKA